MRRLPQQLLDLCVNREVCPILRIVVAAQHALLREGLRELLKRWSGIEVLAAAPTARDAARAAAQGAADALVLARSSRPRDDAEAVRALRATTPRCKVVFLEPFQRAPLTGGVDADHTLGSTVGIAGLVQALSAVCGGVAAPAAADRGHADSADDPRLLLTPRECDIVRAVCTGLGNRAIARQLGITEKTVKNHLSGIYHRANLRGRTQLAMWAAARGLAPEEAPAAR